jgi:hypothetical protein
MYEEITNLFPDLILIQSEVFEMLHFKTNPAKLMEYFQKELNYILNSIQLEKLISILQKYENCQNKYRKTRKQENAK